MIGEIALLNPTFILAVTYSGNIVALTWIGLRQEEIRRRQIRTADRLRDELVNVNHRLASVDDSGIVLPQESFNRKERDFRPSE